MAARATHNAAAATNETLNNNDTSMASSNYSSSNNNMSSSRNSSMKNNNSSTYSNSNSDSNSNMPNTKLSDMPPEITRLIGAKLGPQAVARFAASHPAIRSHVGPTAVENSTKRVVEQFKRAHGVTSEQCLRVPIAAAMSQLRYMCTHPTAGLRKAARHVVTPARAGFNNDDKPTFNFEYPTKMCEGFVRLLRARPQGGDRIFCLQIFMNDYQFDVLIRANMTNRSLFLMKIRRPSPNVQWSTFMVENSIKRLVMANIESRPTF